MVALAQFTKLNGNESGPLKSSSSFAAVSVTVTLVMPVKLTCTPFWLAVMLLPFELIVTGPALLRLMFKTEPDSTAKFSAAANASALAALSPPGSTAVTV